MGAAILRQWRASYCLLERNIRLRATDTGIGFIGIIHAESVRGC
jgi:hypothetical protein